MKYIICILLLKVAQLDTKAHTRQGTRAGKDIGAFDDTQIRSALQCHIKSAGGKEFVQGKQGRNGRTLRSSNLGRASSTRGPPIDQTRQKMKMASITWGGGGHANSWNLFETTEETDYIEQNHYMRYNTRTWGSKKALS